MLNNVHKILQQVEIIQRNSCINYYCYLILMPEMSFNPILSAVFRSNAGGFSKPIDAPNRLANSTSVVLSLPISLMEL